MNDFTIIPYVAQSGTTWKRERELQYSAVRAYSAKVAHQKRRKASSKRANAGVSKPEPDSTKRDVHSVSVKRQRSLPDLIVVSESERSEDSSVDQPLRPQRDVTFFDGNHDEVLRIALKSLALARLAYETANDETLSEANEYHRITLRHIRLSLEDPVIAVKDQTLAAVLIIALFDLVTGQDEVEVSTSLSRHFDGAVALLRMRGSSVVKNDFENHILHRLWANLFFHCHATRRRIPDGLQDLYMDFVRSSNTQKNIQHNLSSTVHLNLASYRASIEDGTLTDPIQIIKDAQMQIQHAKTSWIVLDTLAGHQGSSANLLGQELSADAHESVSHQTESPIRWFDAISTMWMCSIILEQAERVGDHSIWSNSELDRLVEKASGDLECEAMRICQHTNRMLQSDAKTAQIPRRHSTDTSSISALSSYPLLSVHNTFDFRKMVTSGDFIIPGIPAIGVLVWPLYTAGRASRAVSTRQTCVRLLFQISHDHLVPLAAKAAECLEADYSMSEAGLAALGTF